MIFLATKKALAELIRNKIELKSVMIDRTITRLDLNPLQKLFSVVVEIEGEGMITIRCPEENWDECIWNEIEYKDNFWQLKENNKKDQ